MRGDITPPPRQSRPVNPRQPNTSPLPQPEIPTPSLPTPTPVAHTVAQPLALDTDAHTVAPQQPSKHRFVQRRPLASLLLAVVVLIILGLLSGLFWYSNQLSAVEPGSSEKVRLTIEPGSSPSAVAALLKRNGLIKSVSAFGWYLRVEGKAVSLQSGSYRLGKGDDVPTIVKHITSGMTDTFSIQFLPGATIAQHRKVLLDAGYSEQDVDAALQKNYQHPLFESKPNGSDLEGYIYGETYNFAATTTPEQILVRTFDQFQSVIEKQKLKQAYAARGFTLYQAITMASIVQREVATASDAAQVAQVFELRLRNDMPLGSDVTYQYIADKTGQARSVDLDSPYNTRRYKGLPPGPISSPGIDSLTAIGSPASGDFVYFLSGDDDKTYFARTNEEHEKNIRDHCQKKCQII